MKKVLKIVLILLLVGGLGAAVFYVIKTNKKEIEVFETKQPVKISIGKDAVATGKIVPREEIEIKPNISGIIDKLYVKEGDRINNGDLIALIRVVPDPSTLNSLKQQIKQAEVSVANETRNYNRQKNLFNQGVVSRSQYEIALASYDLAKQNLQAARTQYQAERTGVPPGLEQFATTQVRATLTGMVLDLPAELGDNVQEINNFSVGTTIATIADINDMVFEGKVDEAEAGKLVEGMDLKITVGAIQGEEFDAKLFFISPKGVEEAGTVKFEIKANVLLKDDQFIRSGYSANAQIELEKRENVLAIDEALVQYDDGKPFVEVLVGDDKYEKKDIELGVSDGLNVEVVDGINESDKIKIWNPVVDEDEDEDKEDS